MNLHQLRFVHEAVRQNFNLTDTAKALFTSQPGVSKAIIEFEDELGVEIFKRHGKRIRGLTEPGKAILKSIDVIIHEMDSIKQAAKEFTTQDAGNLVIATAYSEAHYFLPKTTSQFISKFPKVQLSTRQGTVQQLVDYIQNGVADIALIMEYEEEIDGIVEIPFNQWEYYLIVPHGHPLSQTQIITLDEIVRYPLVTYEQMFPGRRRVDRVLKQRGLKPEIRGTARSADAIKTYVELGVGVGLIVNLAYDKERDKNLHAIPVGHIFGVGNSHLLIRKNTYLRSYVYAFIELLSPALNRKAVETILSEKETVHKV